MPSNDTSVLRTYLGFGWSGDPVSPPPDEFTRWAREYFFTFGFVVAIALGTLDYKIAGVDWYLANYLTPMLLCWVAVAALFDRERIDARGIWRHRLAGMALWVCMIAGAGFAVAVHGRAAISPIAKMLLGDPAPWLWLCVVWLALPAMFSRQYSVIARVCVWALMLYGSWCLLSCITSVKTPMSLHWFAAERVTALGAGICWLRVRPAMPVVVDKIVRFALGFWIVFIFASALVGLADRLGGRGLQNWLGDHELVYVEKPDVAAQLDYPPRRFIFPMLDINRLGYQTMILIFFLMAAARGIAPGNAGGGSPRFPLRRLREKVGPRGLCLAAIALAALPLVFCGTRGTLLAAMAGMVFAALLSSRKAAMAMLAGCLIFAALVAATGQRHLKMIFDKQTYSGTGPLSSMQQRLLGWRFGVVFIKANPLTGCGYGAKNIKEAYQNYVRIEGSEREVNALNGGVELQHLHNLWLEMTAESGLPALGFFLVFLCLRWVLLARAWRGGPPETRREMAIWCGGECAIVLAGVLFYMLKQNSCLLTWFFWMHALSIAEEKAMGTAAPPSATA